MLTVANMYRMTVKDISQQLDVGVVITKILFIKMKIKKKIYAKTGFLKLNQKIRKKIYLYFPLFHNIFKTQKQYNTLKLPYGYFVLIMGH